MRCFVVSHHALSMCFLTRKTEMFSISHKQLSCLTRGEKILVSLPLPTDYWTDSEWTNETSAPDKLIAWAKAGLNLPKHAHIVNASPRNIWLDCSNPKGGLTEYYGAIIPSIETWSVNALRPIPSTVIAVEISPDPNDWPDIKPAAKLVWPLSWLSPSGYMFDSVAGNW